MSRPIGPHELVKRILQGTAPPRPLFLPIVFSHAARIQNLPLRMFLSNPTKITQALRQIRGYVHSDGLTCYFDPYLEIEALGGDLDWGSSDKPVVHWARNPVNGDLPAGLHAVDELVTRGRIPVAVEVIRRLKSMVRDECLLTVGIRGPFSLAAQLMQAGQGVSGETRISANALELASEVIAPVATAFVEAGANAVIISEELPPSSSGYADLASLLTTTINIVRFYQAIPVLLLSSVSQYLSIASQDLLDCIVCPVVSGTRPSLQEELTKPAPATLGVAIPSSIFLESQAGIEKFAEEFRRLNPGFQPPLITTSGDIPDTADLRNANKLRDLLIA